MDALWLQTYWTNMAFAMQVHFKGTKTVSTVVATGYSNPKVRNNYLSKTSTIKKDLKLTDED